MSADIMFSYHIISIYVCSDMIIKQYTYQIPMYDHRLMHNRLYICIYKVNGIQALIVHEMCYCLQKKTEQ